MLVTLCWCVRRCRWLFFSLFFSFLFFFLTQKPIQCRGAPQNSVFLRSVNVMWHRCEFGSLTGVSQLNWRTSESKLLPFRLLHDEWAPAIVIIVFNLLWIELFTELDTYLWSIIAPVLNSSPLTLDTKEAEETVGRNLNKRPFGLMFWSPATIFVKLFSVSSGSQSW